MNKYATSGESRQASTPLSTQAMEDIAKLSDEEANIEIALLRGWSRAETCNGFWSPSPNSRLFDKPPSYCSDLNAMHEAEKTLPEYGNIELDGAIFDSPRSLYVYLLLKYQDSWPVLGPTAGRIFTACHATARQRAEAFLAVGGRGSGACAQPHPSDDGRERNEGHIGDPSEYGDSN